MPFSASRRLLPFRDRGTLLERQRDLTAEAGRVDREQQRLAAEFSAVRRELRTIRDMLWPTRPGHAFRNVRRPRFPGPAPIPPPVRGAQAIRGRELRYAALGVLVRAGSPMSLPEIHRALHLAGYRIAGNGVVKRLGDALAYECRKGRVTRVARRTYALGELSPARRRRARAR
jgi:hypothetical protein